MPASPSSSRTGAPGVQEGRTRGGSDVGRRFGASVKEGRKGGREEGRKERKKREGERSALARAGRSRRRRERECEREFYRAFVGGWEVREQASASRQVWVGPRRGITAAARGREGCTSVLEGGLVDGGVHGGVSRRGGVVVEAEEIDFLAGALSVEVGRDPGERIDRGELPERLGNGWRGDGGGASGDEADRSGELELENGRHAAVLLEDDDFASPDVLRETDGSRRDVDGLLLF
mmetsp:Transcript_7845/g.24042  ORF Transcript_7845/g.24042 Transcript_7845/m.24042 type:complete len:235 (+) Transcript_7845:907-1611(+)